MRADRRTMLKGSAALAAVPLAVGMAGGITRHFIVFDSRIPESASFAAGIAGQRFDVGHTHDTRWAALRSQLPDMDKVEGLTGWSDWIAVRGELEARGLRAANEIRVAAPISGKAHLFRWSMKRR